MYGTNISHQNYMHCTQVNFIASHFISFLSYFLYTFKTFLFLSCISVKYSEHETGNEVQNVMGLAKCDFTKAIHLNFIKNLSVKATHFGPFSMFFLVDDLI